MTSRTLSRPQFTAAALALGTALTLSACGGSATPLAAPAASTAMSDKTHVRQDGDA
jgi:predicted lipoprotein